MYQIPPSSLTGDSKSTFKLPWVNEETYLTKQNQLVVRFAAGDRADVFCRQISNAMLKMIDEKHQVTYYFHHDSI